MDPTKDKGTIDWLLRTFATFWIYMVLGINVLALYIVYLQERSIWATIETAQSWFGPHNIINGVLILLLLSPALLAFWILDRRQQRRKD